MEKKLYGTCKENKNNPASASVRVKNIFAGCRCGIITDVRNENGSEKLDCVYSSEYKYACRGRDDKAEYNDYPEIKVALNGGSEKIVWSQKQYDFLSQKYSDDTLSVHPALWNNGTNNLLSGVFEVLPGRIYQVRGYDMANISFVKTNNIDKTGFTEDDHWLVLDTLMSTECTEASMNLFADYISYKLYNGKSENKISLKNKISGIIISHSHVDHYGGMKTVSDFLCKYDKKSCDGEVIDVSGDIIVPEGFTEHSVSENIYVGNAMARRASYQYGSFIKPDGENDYTGSISIGIGQGQSTGTISFCTPTYEVGKNQMLMIEELHFDCQLTPGTEAPAEMNNYFHEYNALWLAENCTGTLHNLYTLRGAQVRDGKEWAKFLVEASAIYGNKTDVIFQSHNWPHWKDSTDIREFLLDTASIYKYINDQTLHYMNQGYKMNEAADMLTIPRRLQKNWCTKPFYGTPKHNAKAVYQKYLGWYDANPLHLEELPPEQLAQEQMRYMMVSGGTEGILSEIKADILRGNYWIAAYMAQQIVLGHKDNDTVNKARELCADALEQLGYQCESGIWRNAYLCASYELRNGKGRVSPSGSADTMKSMTAEMLLDYISILFDGEIASARVTYDGVLNISGERFAFIIRNGAIMYYKLNEKEYGYATGKDGEISLKKETLIFMTGLTQKKMSKFDMYAQLCSCDSENADFLQKIASCMINLSSDRYKYFDIVSKHDSEVKVDDEIFDIENIVRECIGFLDKLKNDSLVNGGSVTFERDNLEKWRKYYKILKEETNIIMDSYFFSFTDGGKFGISTDGCLVKAEYWFTMYSLYRYLGRKYINNDCVFCGMADNAEKVAKLKKKIVLLESYLPEYFGDADKNGYKIDNEDKVAWKYLQGEDKDVFSLCELTERLSISYRELLEIVEK